MITATHMQAQNPRDYHLDFVQSEAMCGMPFGLTGCLDAPNTIAAGSHYRYEYVSGISFCTSAFPMPSACRRPAVL